MGVHPAVHGGQQRRSSETAERGRRKTFASRETLGIDEVPLSIQPEQADYDRQFSEPAITQLGFSFLLQDVNAQVWTLLLQYLDMAEQVLQFRTEKRRESDSSSFEWTLSTYCTSCSCWA